jgi:hypothetical protein
MRIAPPLVLFEVRPLVEDSALEPSSPGRRYVARLHRVAPNPRLLWETETRHPGRVAARRDILADIRRCLALSAEAEDERFKNRIRANARSRTGLAPEPPIDIDAVLEGICITKNDWSKDERLSLALELIFPNTLAELEVAPRWHRTKGKGRPVVVDRLTAKIARLMWAWERATGTEASLGDGSAFVTVLDAVAAPLHLNRRGTKRRLRCIRDALQAEREKLLSKRLYWEKTPGSLAN